MREVDPIHWSLVRSQCERCLAPIRFPSGPAQQTLPPVEEVGMALVFATNGQAVRTMTYRPHECSGERPIDPSTGEAVLSWSELRELNQRLSLEYACPKCGSEPGFPCVDMRSRSRLTNWPHLERYPEGAPD